MRHRVCRDKCSDQKPGDLIQGPCNQGQRQRQGRHQKMCTVKLHIDITSLYTRKWGRDKLWQFQGFSQPTWAVNQWSFTTINHSNGPALAPLLDQCPQVCARKLEGCSQSRTSGDLAHNPTHLHTVLAQRSFPSCNFQSTSSSEGTKHSQQQGHVDLANLASNCLSGNKLIQSHGLYTALHWRSCSHIFLSHRNVLVSSDAAASPAKHGAELIASLLWLTLNLINHSPHRQPPTSPVQKKLREAEITIWQSFSMSTTKVWKLYSSNICQNWRHSITTAARKETASVDWVALFFCTLPLQLPSFWPLLAPPPPHQPFPLQDLLSLLYYCCLQWLAIFVLL